ncbi:unnamed protein product, partial [Effrenium voratum]
MAWGEADGLPTRASLLPFEIERELQKFRSGGCELCRLRPTQAEPQVAELPVHCLRFAQHGINSKMVFGNGRRGDSSVYCLVHDLLCNRLSLAEIPPLQVVLDGDLFFSLDNRRLAAFKMLQGLWAHQVVKVPCVIWHKHTDDSEIRHKFKLAKTTTPELHHGLGIKLNGDLHEAWHMGEPLFRRPQEWCAPLQATSARQQGEGSANSKELETEAPTPPSQATGPGETGGRCLVCQGLCELAETPVEHPKKSKGKKWTKDNNAGKETQASSCSSNPPGPTMQAAESPSLVNQNEVAAKPPTTWAEIVGAKQPAPGVPAAPAPAAPALPASKAPEPTPKPPPPPPPQSPPTPAAAPWRPPLPPPSFPPPQQEACLPAPLSAPHCAPPASDCKEVAQNRCQDSFQTQLPSSGSFASSQDEPGEPLPESHQEAEGVADDFLSAEDAESYRSESDEDILGQDEPDFQEDAPADPSTERAVLEDLLSEMRQQRDVCHVGDLKGRLVSGTFRVLSGSDFRLRRSKSQLVVDQGPPQLLGCRVHIIGALNRNRAWDHDRCWVRILAARVAVEGVGVGRKQVKQDLGRAWDASTAQAAMLFGTVVCAREQQSPRQSKVVCARSRLVRSLNCMLFRPINGKFPMIRVPWNPQLEPPALHDLHVVELKSWRDGLPVGMHEEVLHMSNRDSDESVVYAIKRSLNLTDWEEHSKYCSIPIEEETIAISAKGADVQCDRQDLRNNFSICVEHPGWPGNMAFSLVEGELQVHVVDATAYLAAELSGSDLEAQARLRSCGAWLLDCEDKPAEHSLPLLQEEFVKKIDLTEGQDRLTLTFSFSINGGQLNRQDHFESITRCHRRLSYQAADHVGPGKTADLLEAVSTLVGQIEQAALGRGESFPLEHWDPHVGLQSRLDSRRIVGCLSFLVNLYAGRVLSNPALWSEFLSLDETQQVMPTWLYSRADTQNLRSLQRLLPPSEVTEVCAQVCTKQVIDALTSTLAQEHLSGEQRWAVQKALLRQIRMSLPGGFYQLGEKAPWPGPRKGQLFFRPKIFHASAPLSRYIDVLGQRMLKWLKGWRPGLCSWLCPSLRDIQEAVDRTNARLDSLRFAGFVMRQISRMRDLSVASRKISNAIVGYAGPGAFEVIIPSSSSAHFSLSVPVNTLRSATCSLEFDVDAQCLRIMNVDPWRRCSYSWVVKPWVTQVECVISRNFAQPIKHHASANAMIISEITFNSSAGPVSLSVGHRMYPEVFSEFPDLGHVHLMEKDLDAYAQTWHKIWRCRTHAAASEAAAYTEWMHPGRLHMEDGKVSCCVVLHGTDEHPRPQPGDLAILRCSPAEAAREVLLYGEVLDCKPSKSQWKIKACRTPNCSRANCGFLHPGEEAEGALFQLEVGLSEVSRHAQKEQKRFLEAADATAFKLQLVGVPVVDRQNLKLVEELPNKLRTRKGRESPIAAHLTSLQAPTVEQEQREMRPLATFQQVERSVREGAYAVRGSGLNDMQLSAVMRGLQHRFSVVQGPPGTGKTTFLVHLVTALTNLELDPSLSRSRSAQPAAAESFGRILVTTPSNQAADECLRRLVQESDIPAHYITRVYARTIEYKFGSKLRLGWDPYDSNLTRTEHMV